MYRYMNRCIRRQCLLCVCMVCLCNCSIGSTVQLESISMYSCLLHSSMRISKGGCDSWYHPHVVRHQSSQSIDYCFIVFLFSPFMSVRIVILLALLSLLLFFGCFFLPRRPHSSVFVCWIGRISLADWKIKDVHYRRGTLYVNRRPIQTSSTKIFGKQQTLFRPRKLT